MQQPAVVGRLTLLGPLLRLDRLPARLDGLRRGGDVVGEDVGVATDELGDDAARDVVDVERVVDVVLADPGVEGHLQEDVAELLDHVPAVAGLERLGRLVGLLDEVGHERLVGLRGVPGAPTG